MKFLPIGPPYRLQVSTKRLKAKLLVLLYKITIQLILLCTKFFLTRFTICCTIPIPSSKNNFSQCDLVLFVNHPSPFLHLIHFISFHHLHWLQVRDYFPPFLLNYIIKWRVLHIIICLRTITCTVCTLTAFRANVSLLLAATSSCLTSSLTATTFEKSSYSLVHILDIFFTVPVSMSFSSFHACFVRGSSSIIFFNY